MQGVVGCMIELRHDKVQAALSAIEPIQHLLFSSDWLLREGILHQTARDP